MNVSPRKTNARKRTDPSPTTTALRDGAKLPFDIDDVIVRVRDAVKSFRTAALFELAADGYSSTFEVLVGCIISIRTRDETTVDVARNLFKVARTPRQISELSWKRIDTLIGACTFHEPKAKQIKQIAERAVREYRGELPCDADVLMSFAGVGPKCAHLALGIACRQPYIGVDVHVHRVTNRWGYVSANDPERTMRQLQEKLPRRYWIEINRLLVPFGKHICTGSLPKCSTCPVLRYCRQIGVDKHR